MEVRRISHKDTYKIRQLILRPNGTEKDCHFEGDNEDQTFHLGAFVDSQLVSIASFFFERHPKFDEPYQFRLRGMATLNEHRMKGLSSALLNRGFPIVKQNQCHLVWCNARLEAVGFYLKNGFEKVSEEFDVPNIGPHILMVKKL